MKRIFVCLLAMALALTIPGTGVTVKADDTIPATEVAGNEESMPILALGADLSPDQRAKVLSLLGLTEADIVNYRVITVTNEDEHKYLDAYMEASVIGTKSLSSVLIIPKESGHGIKVTTHNINYCTTGMYRNALLTAGVSDAEIIVAAPTSISGTAALIGAVKGYEALSGTEVAEHALDTAMDEMITTGEIAEEIAAQTGADSGEVEELIAFVKAKVAAGELESEEEILGVIREGEEKFSVSLTEEQKQQIVDIMMKINELGLDPQMLIEQAEDLYSQFGTEFFEDLEIDLDRLDLDNLNLDGLDTQAFEEEGLLSKIVNAIKDFFAGIF